MADLRLGQGGVVTIEGGAGIGKTRLLGEAARLAAAEGAVTRLGAGDPASSLVPLAPLLDPLTRGPEPAVDREALRRVERLPLERYWILEEIQDALERAAMSRPLMVGIDDLQFCDALTLLALRALPPRLSGHAVLWVLAARRPHASRDAARTLRHLEADGAVALALEPLTDETIRRIAETALGGRLDAALDRRVSATQGRPFELAEMLRGFEAEGAVAVIDGEARLVGAALPTRYRDAIRERLDELPSAAADAVRALAVLGRDGTPEQLAAFLGDEVTQLLVPLREALASDLIAERADRLEFRHDLIREAVEATMPAALKQGFRRRAIDVLERGGASPVVLAELMYDLGRPGDLRTVELLRRAAHQLAASAPADAARLGDRALTLATGHVDDLSELAIETIRLRWRAGRPAEAASLATATLDGRLSADVEAALRLEFAALSTQYSFGDAVVQCRRGLQAGPDSPTLRARLAALLSLALLNSGEIEAAAAEIPGAIDAARTAEDPAAEVLAVACSSTAAWYDGDLQRALELSERAIAIADAGGRGSRDLWTPEIWHAMVLQTLGLDAEALALADAGLRTASGGGLPELARYWVTLRSRLLLDAGRLDDCRSEAEAALAMADDLGPGNWTEATAIYALGRLALLFSDDGARAGAHAHADRLRAADTRLLRREGLWLGTLLADAEDDMAGVERHSREAAEAFGTPQPALATPHDPFDGVLFVRAVLRAGLRPRAEAAAQHLRRIADRNPGYVLLRAVADHAAGVLERDTDALHRASAAYERAGRELGRAVAEEDLADLALACADVDGAVLHLRAALDAYSTGPATQSAARVRGRLRDLGARAARPGRSPRARGWRNLTPSQLDVVRLVATGATNREVAQALFLSPHTVNSHLRHAFAKLGIRSRVELARLMAEAGPPADLAASE